MMGRLVHFLNFERKQFPMLITEAFKDPGGERGPRAHGVIFGPFGVEYVADIPYHAGKIANSWHWPSRNIEARRKKGPKSGQPLVDPKKIAAKAVA